MDQHTTLQPVPKSGTGVARTRPSRADTPRPDPARPDPARPDPPRRRYKAPPLPEATFLRTALEGAGAVLAAFAAMFTAAGLGLYLTGALSYASLPSAATGMVSLAVGGSAKVGTQASIGGFMSAGLDGNLRGMPLGIGVLGAVVLGLAFFLPLRHRRTDRDVFVVRTAVAGCTGFCTLLVIALSAKGTVILPESVTARVQPNVGDTGNSMLSGIIGGVGSDLSKSLSHLRFEVGAVSTLFGGLLWMTVVLCLGSVAARRARLPTPRSESVLRRTMGPAASAVITVVVALAVLLFVLGMVAAVVIAAAGNGGNGGKVAGAVLLAGPNLVFAALSIGTGVPWSMTTGQDTSASGSSPLSGLAGLMGGGSGPGGILGGGGSGAFGAPTHKSLSLASLASGGSPAWLLLLLLAVAALLTSGVLTAGRTPLRVTREGTPLLTRTGRAAVNAVRLGGVWSVVLCTAVLVGQASGHMSVSLMSMSMLSLNAHLGANAFLAFVSGLLAGAAAGFLGSLLRDAKSARTAGNARTPGTARTAEKAEHPMIAGQ